MNHPPTKPHKHHHAHPENPLILPRPPLHHPDRIPTDPQCVRNAVQPFLCPLEDLSLLTKITEHRTPAVQILVERGVGGGEEVLFP